MYVRQSEFGDRVPSNTPASCHSSAIFHAKKTPILAYFEPTTLTTHDIAPTHHKDWPSSVGLYKQESHGQDNICVKVKDAMM